MKKTDEILREIGISRVALNKGAKYSKGFMEDGNIGEGYVAGLKVDAGTRKKTDDNVLDNIVSYDHAEAKNAYMGQINMITASSFTGLQGSTLGYDILRNPEVDEASSLFSVKQWDGSELPIYDSKPLQNALVEYFGTEQERRHPLTPGAMSICANKGVIASRPKENRELNEDECYGVWSAIAISFAEDNTKDSDMFVEDAGIWKDPSEDKLVEYLNEKRHAIANSIAECGEDNHVRYKSSWIGFAYTMMEPGEIGNAITVVPYFTFPITAIPNGDINKPEESFYSLQDINLSEWLDKMGYESLTKNGIKY